LRAKVQPALPKTAEQFVRNTPDFAKTTNGNNARFLLHSCEVNDDVIVFASDFFLQYLCISETVCVDGTFQCVPANFTQLFTISYYYNEKLIPGVLVLSKRRTKEFYAIVFKILINYLTSRGWLLEARTVICDFEARVIRGVREALPNVHVHGCCHMEKSAKVRSQQRLSP
jgi:hypothetical protein